MLGQGEALFTDLDMPACSPGISVLSARLSSPRSSGRLRCDVTPDERDCQRFLNRTAASRPLILERQTRHGGGESQRQDRSYYGRQQGDWVRISASTW